MSSIGNHMGTSLESLNHNSPKPGEGSDWHPVRTDSRRSGWRRLGVLFLVFLSGGIFVWWWSIDSGLKRAEQSAVRGSWDLAVDQLNRYLRWHPGDPSAHFLIAEAYIKSESGNSIQTIEQAVFHLQQIQADSPQAAEARLQEARLTLLLLKRPAKAERLFREALRLNPDSYEANLLLWKLLDITGRHVLSEPYFWRAYELAPSLQRGLLLRDWFLSELYPETLYASLYEQMGAEKVGNIPASVNLLVQFREIEPEAAFLHAALAKYYLDIGNLKATMDLLKEAPDLTKAMEDPLFASVLFEALIDLGEFPKAEECFKQYPQPHSGYYFWRSEGMFHDYIRSDCTAAAASFRQALSTSAGKFDWELMTSLSVCLRKTGEIPESQQLQSRVDRLTTKVLTVEHTSHLRNLLHNPQQPEVARELMNFYDEFGLEREASAWKDYRHGLDLRKTPTPGDH